MHAGVLRDVERQRIKRERQLDFEMQAALEKEFRKTQSVVDTTSEAPPDGPGVAFNAGMMPDMNATPRKSDGMGAGR